MPELPEVRTVAKVLNNKIKGKIITNVRVLYPKIIDTNSLDFNNLIGKRINNIRTYGKYLIFEIDDLFLISHLRMEGKYFIKDVNDVIDKHEHILFTLDYNVSLRYHDTRKFGRMFLTNDINSYNGLNKLGYEVFDDKLSGNYLYDKFSKSNLTVKELLLDQSIMAGLGNIYTNEVLFLCKINPYKRGYELGLNDCESIIANSRFILSEAIKDGGTTIKSYTSSLGVTGKYQEKLMVHKRDSLCCKVCNGLILKDKIGGRSTYYCPVCQNVKQNNIKK